MIVLHAFVVAFALLQPAQNADHLVGITVHGNTATADEEIIQAAGVTIGMPVDARTTEEVAARLRALKRFQTVDVMTRFASIADPTQILLIIVVDEGPVTIAHGDRGSGARVVKTRGSHVMFSPILDYEDGYGLSYGVRVAMPNALGRRTRVSFPATWGGEKRAAVEVEKVTARGPLTRVKTGAAASRRTHPFFEAEDDRRGVWGRAERDFGAWLRGGATAAWDHVSFLGATDRVGRLGVDVVFDTRIDPMLARNAIYARAAWDRLAFANRVRAARTELDGRAYIGFVGRSVLIVRALRQDSNRPLPAYLMPTLGGMATLRGFRAGTAVGDTLVTTSAELRLPLSSPLSVGQLGVSAFVDAATVYEKGERYRDQALRRGVGGGVWLSAAIVRLNLIVAHGIGGTTRVHVGTTVTF